jgi:hypothetical protein
MNNNELAAQCLIEAANLLGESAGRNGVAMRYHEARYKNLKKQNDENENNTTEDREKLYNNSRWGDKTPVKANTIEEIHNKKQYEELKKTKNLPADEYQAASNRKTDSTGQAVRFTHYNQGRGFDSDAVKIKSYLGPEYDNGKKIGNELNGYKNIRKKPKNIELHNKINKRAGINESIEFTELEDYLSEN